MARKRPVLFILARLLGGNTFSRQVMAAVERMPWVDPHFVFLDGEDYARYWNRVPLLNRRADLWVSQSIMRLKLAEAPPPPCEAAFVQGFELVTCLPALRRRCPAVLAHDSTNVSSYRLLRDEHPGPLASLACRAKALAFTARYRRAMRSVRVFMPRTRWAADSLVRDFRIHPEKILVTPAGLDLEAWSPRPPVPSPPDASVTRDTPSGEDRLNLLFVGHDFERKGGPLLLEVFRRYLHPRARLRIVSSDPCLHGLALPEGVEHLAWPGQGDRRALLEVFRGSDIFVFPTRKEQMGMVLTEAAAVGLPMVATDVGGVDEIVREGENGCLLSPRAGVEEWAIAILGLLADTERRLAYGRASRALAERELSREVLRSRLETAFESCFADAADALVPEPAAWRRADSAVG